MNPSERVSLPRRLRHFLFGQPIHSAKALHERLGVAMGLPVFASDALSSSAYATEAILSVLILGGMAIVSMQLWIAAAISLLIVIVAWSYWQTIHAYPGGGGSYIVASDNLGETPGLIAAAALMIDYVLTVAVSVAAGVAAIVSAYPELHPYLVPISAGCIVLIGFANLRGVRESGALFSLPTYGFLIGMFTMLGFCLYRSMVTHPTAQSIVSDPGVIGSEAKVFLAYLILRSFAAGCTALTGIEAVSNGVPAFRPPEAQNASKTLVIMAALLTVLFLGIGYFAMHLPHVELFATKNPQYTTLISQIAAWAFGSNQSFGFYFVQYATAAILILAANTSFADFPRLSSLLARDGYLPRALSRQGDRLVFQNGIVVLAVASSLLIWAYHGELDQLLPLYAVGVFLAFTLSQSGMVVHWKRTKEKGHRLSMVVNLLGALITGTVTIVLLVTKFAEGAWIIAVLTTAFYLVFRAIRARYDSIAKQLAVDFEKPKPLEHHTVLLLVPRIHSGIIKALNYALALHGECRAIHVAINDKSIPAIKEGWKTYGDDIPLIVLQSPYRSLIDPILEYVDQIRRERPDETVTVIVPEAVPTHWQHKVLQENIAFQLKYALGTRKNVVVTNVRYFLD